MAEEKRTFDNDVRVLLSVSQLKSNRFRSTYQQWFTKAVYIAIALQRK